MKTSPMSPSVAAVKTAGVKSGAVAVNMLCVHYTTHSHKIECLKAEERILCAALSHDTVFMLCLA